MATDRPTKLWEAVERWRRYHPLLQMYVASRVARTDIGIEWAENAERLALGRHCQAHADPVEAWKLLDAPNRRDVLRAAKLPLSLTTATWPDVFVAFAKLVEADRHEGEPVDTSVEATVKIPDELLVWGDSQQLAWLRPWSSEVREMLALPQPLAPEQTERLLSRLEALVHEAVVASRQDLVLGLDLFTAELLGMSVTFDSPHGKVEVGRNAAWAYHELTVVMGASEPKAAAKAAAKAKALLADEFPGVRISGVFRQEDEKCTVCGDDVSESTALIEMEGGLICRGCWQYMTEWSRVKETGA